MVDVALYSDRCELMRELKQYIDQRVEDVSAAVGQRTTPV